MKKEYAAIGMMSGTSLDGLDIASCIFIEEDGRWSFTLEEWTTLPYAEKWLTRLVDAPALSGRDLTQLNVEYGHYIGQTALKFLKTYGIKPDLVASHGHTIFHQPEKGFTLQIGDGAAICSYLQVPLVCDFRSVDVALGGQGAPLVPIGDQLLFGKYGACLNLGGIANISVERKKERVAWDICPVNMALNRLAKERDLPFDDKGQLARSGKLIQELYNLLNLLEFYQDEPPKSTGYEWYKKYVRSLIDRYIEHPLEDRLHTVTEHIALQLSKAIPHGTKNMLITGGGTHNTYLIERLQSHTSVDLIIPPDQIIDFKEAIIFAFLGVLRMQHRENCMASVTGASIDNVGGAIYHS